jgi:hypothetical protein
MVSDYLDGIKYTEYIDDREIFLGILVWTTLRRMMQLKIGSVKNIMFILKVLVLGIGNYY